MAVIMEVLSNNERLIEGHRQADKGGGIGGSAKKLGIDSKRTTCNQILLLLQNYWH